jgi:hypothetical protein
VGLNLEGTGLLGEGRGQQGEAGDDAGGLHCGRSVWSGGLRWEEDV